MAEEQNKLVVFQEKGIRRIWHNEEWWFAIVDVEEGNIQLSEKIG